MRSEQRQDDVKLLIDSVEALRSNFYLDGDGLPCIRVTEAGIQRAWELCDEKGKATARTRAFLRTQFWQATNRTRHLADGDLKVALDYLIEKAFKGERQNTRTRAVTEGNYNFEGVVVFAGTLTPDSPGVTINASERKVTYQEKTETLWRAIIAPAIQAQVQANKSTLRKNLNWFSRDLGELKEEFRKEGLDLSIAHRQDGSWVTIIRDDELFHPGPLLVKPDDELASASALPSGRNTKEGKELTLSEATQIEIEDTRKGDAQ